MYIDGHYNCSMFETNYIASDQIHIKRSCATVHIKRHTGSFIKIGLQMINF